MRFPRMAIFVAHETHQTTRKNTRRRRTRNSTEENEGNEGFFKSTTALAFLRPLAKAFGVAFCELVLSQEDKLPTKHTNTRERNFADKKSPNRFRVFGVFRGRHHFFVIRGKVGEAVDLREDEFL